VENVLNLGIDKPTGYNASPLTMKLRIKDILRDKRLTQTALSDLVGVKKGFMSEIIAGKKNPSVETLGKIADALNVSIGELFESPPPIDIPVLGRVGAGAEVSMDGQGGCALYELPCPAQLDPQGLAAVEVVGDSMSPAIPPGAVLFYRRDADRGVPTEAIGRVCIAETADGNVWAKQVKTGTQPGLFHLISINPASDNLLDQRINWAAPVLLALPPELVRQPFQTG